MTGLGRAALALLLALLAGACTHARQHALSGLEHALAGRSSATAALEEWCARRQLAASPMIAAQVLPDPAAPAPQGIRGLFGAGQTIAYRHVRLRCGGRVLSEARNWYVPALLTPAMNHTLETTDTPFGRVVTPLAFTRQPGRETGRPAGLPAGYHPVAPRRSASARWPGVQRGGGMLYARQPVLA